MAFLGSTKFNTSFLINTTLINKEQNKFFSYLRFILYNKTDFKTINTTKPFSIDNERQLFNKIKEIMIFYLNKYPTTLDYDIEYLNNNKNNMEFNIYNCYVIRIGEKEILHFYLNMANDILKLLNADKNYIKEIFKYIINGKKLHIYNKFEDKLLKYKTYLLSIYPLFNIDKI